MGCGASSTAQREREKEAEKEEKRLEQEEDREGAVDVIPVQKIDRRSVDMISAREAECKGPDERHLDIPEKEDTPFTKGPRRKGIFIRASPRCRAHFLFMCRPSDHANIEMKEYDSVDDIVKDWSHTGKDIPGVFYVQPVNENCCVASLAPARYMYRWNAEGARCTTPGEELKICEKLHSYHAEVSALAQVVLAFLQNLPESIKSASPYLQDDGADKLVKDLDELATCKSARYLSNDLSHFKNLLVELEDNIIYNLFQFSLNIQQQIGYFTGGPADPFSEHVLTLREQAEALLLEKACEEDNLKLLLENGKTVLKQGVDEALQKLFGLLGMNQEEVLPDLDDALRGAIDRIDINANGRCRQMTGTGAIESQEQMLRCLEEDKDPLAVKRRVENAYFEKSPTSCPTLPVMCPPSFFEVDIYIVFPKDEKNTFKKAYLAFWEEGDRLNPVRVAMKEYWIGEGDKCGSGSNSESNDNASDPEDDDEDGDDEDDDEENDSGNEEDDDDETPRWRGFCCTVPVRADVVYCYRIVIDNRAYLTPSCSKKNRMRYCKKFKISPSVGSWSLNVLELTGMI